MRKRTRNQARTRGKRVLTAYTRMVAFFAYAQLSQKWEEWTFRTISWRQAQNLVSLGEAAAVTRKKDGLVQTVGFQALKPTGWERPSPTTLTRATAEAVTNAVTSHATFTKLSQRELAEIEKFKVWPLIGDTKSRLTGPRISDEERREALNLFSVQCLKVHTGSVLRSLKACRAPLRQAA